MQHHFARMTIRKKLLSIVFISCTCALLFVTVIGFIGQYYLIQNQLIKEMQSMAMVIAENSKAGLTFEDRGNLKTIVGALSAKDDVILAQIYSKDHHLFAGYYKDKHQQEVSPVILNRDGVWFESGIAGLTFPVTMHKERIGYIHLQQNMKNRQRNIALLGGLMIGALALALIFAFLFSNNLFIKAMEPLKNLAQTMEEVTATRNYRLRTIASNNDEIGMLAGGFNDMLSEIEQRDDHLEDEVERRTRDLKEAKEAAEAASRAKSMFLANMSHEIRTPMNAVIGLTDLALKKSSDSRQREILRPVRESADTLMGILNDVLDFSKIEAGQLQLTLKPFNLDTVLEAVISSMQWSATDKGLHLKLVKGEGIPPGFFGDELRIRQILLNLISNAVKFTEKGSVVVCVEWGRENDGQMLHFSVLDTGKGIAEELQDSIFHHFVQVDGGYERSHGGTGLGLAISKQLVELMGGSIRVESTPGAGATFSFDLPLQPCSEEDLKVEEHIPDHTGGVSGLTILVVDDNEVNRDLACMVLEENNRVTTAINGLDALHMLLTDDFDVILMDVRMPVMDGLEATRAIRGMERTAEYIGTVLPDELVERLRRRLEGKHHRIIAMTAHAMAGDEELCLQAGMDDYLTKPFIPEQLFLSLRGMKNEVGEQVMAVDDGRMHRLRRGAGLYKASLDEARDFLRSSVHLSEEQIDRLLRTSSTNLAGYFRETYAALENRDNAAVAENLHAMKGLLLQCGLFAWADPAQKLHNDAVNGMETEYFVRLQLLEQGLEELLQPECEIRPGEEKPPEVAAPTEGRVLVLDDDSMLRDIGGLMVETLGFEADTAADGVEAVRMYREAYELGTPYDVVITDLNIVNGMGGVETARSILGINPGAVIIACSGDPENEVMKNHARFGFSNVLKKPFQLDELRSVVGA